MWMIKETGDVAGEIGEMKGPLTKYKREREEQTRKNKTVPVLSPVAPQHEKTGREVERSGELSRKFSLQSAS